MDIEEQKAPGCFGAASVFSVDSKACQACVAFDKCGIASVATLEAIRGMIDVSDILARHAASRKKAQNRIDESKRLALLVSTPIPKKQPVAQAQTVRNTKLEKVVFELSVSEKRNIAKIGANEKIKSMALILCKNNKFTQLAADLRKGVNTFAVTGPSFLRVACTMLISGGFTRAVLVDALMKELEWSESTASSHASIAASLLYAFGIIKVSETNTGQFITNPNNG